MWVRWVRWRCGALGLGLGLDVVVVVVVYARCGMEWDDPEERCGFSFCVFGWCRYC